jgi:FAD/FMN-containing dehydrogenase
VEDAVLAKSTTEREAIWAIRDDVEAIYALYPLFAFDVSVPLPDMEDYVADIEAQINTQWPDNRLIIFGHLGDGNIHVVVAVGSDAPEVKRAVEDIVYGALRDRHGVISAEHGIGQEKKRHLSISRSAAEIALMRTLKQAMDPTRILNPGKVIDV